MNLNDLNDLDDFYDTSFVLQASSLRRKCEAFFETNKN